MHGARLSVFFLLLLSLSCFSQRRHAVNLTTNDGLPITSVRAFHKDSRGYLWVGTDAGVVKFDGLEMSVFNSYNGLPGEKVWDIDEDWNGDMWFACFGEGIAKYDGINFTSYTIEDGLPDKAVRKIACHHPTKTLILATGKACATITEDFEIQSTEDYFLLDSSSTYTEILMNDSVALVLAHKYSKHMSIDLKTNIITPYSSNWMKKYEISAGLVTYNNDTVITNHRRGIVIKTDSSITEIGGMGQVFGITEDGQRKLWLAAWNDSNTIGVDGGLYTFNGENVGNGNKMFNIQTTFGWAIYNDSIQSETWFGTLDKGIYTFPLPYFTLYDNKYFDESNFSVEQIVCRNENEVFAISKNSLIQFLPDKGYEKLKISDVIEIQLKSAETSNKISKDQKIKLLQHKNDPDLFSFKSLDKASNNDIMVVLDHTIPFIISHGLNTMELSYPVRGPFILDENDTITCCDSWASAIYKYGHYQNIQANPDQYQLEGKSIMAKKLYTYQNETWLCSRISGVFIEKDCTIRDLNEEDSTINHLVNAICFDSTGTAYLGGNDGRIEVLSRVERKKEFEVVHKKALPAVLWMHVWKGHLFAGHADGLRIYNLKKIVQGDYSFRFLGETEGNAYRNVNNSDIDDMGNIWLATNEGIVKVDANLILNTRYYPLKTVIDKVDLFNKETDWSAYGIMDRWSKLPLEPVKLSHDENNFSIHFHTLNFVNSNAEQYYYKLEGIDREWTGPTNKTYVVYPYLKPGEYTFSARSRNYTSGLLSEEATFSFTILKPWYFQLWFIISMSAIILITAAILYRMRIKYIRRQEKQKRDIVTKISELETKALQAQMNPHFIFNSMSSIQNFVIDNDVDEALTFMGHFSKVIRMTLDNVDNKAIPLQDELDYLRHYTELEKMRFDDSFEFLLSVENAIDVYNTHIPPMLLQPIIENCIKHAFPDRKFKGIIQLNITLKDKYAYQCTIEDNGIGRAAASRNKSRKNLEHTSKGMKITKDRVRMLNDEEQDKYSLTIVDLFDDKGKATGTRVEIVLPLNL